jgi:hypothetical protein
MNFLPGVIAANRSAVPRPQGGDGIAARFDPATALLFDEKSQRIR